MDFHHHHHHHDDEPLMLFQDDDDDHHQQQEQQQQQYEYDILELALRLRWSSVVMRANLRPSDIARQDSDGLNVLHWACCNPPPLIIVTSLLQLNNHTTTQHLSFAWEACQAREYNNGMTPLLCACACGAPLPMMVALIEACPESLLVADHDGWTPLHYVCYRSNRVGYYYDANQQFHHLEQHHHENIRDGDRGRAAAVDSLSTLSSNDSLSTALRKAHYLLSKCPQLAATDDVMGRTPLHLLCSMYEMELQSAYLFSSSLTTFASFFYYFVNNAVSSIMMDAKQLWTLLKLLIEASSSSRTLSSSPTGAATAETTTTTNSSSSTILHKILSLPSHHEDPPTCLLLFALTQCKQSLLLSPSTQPPSQQQQQQQHSIQQQHPFSSQSQSLPVLLQQDSNGNTPLHLAILLGRYSAASLLAQQDPRAARVINRQGQTPLAIACGFAKLQSRRRTKPSRSQQIQQQHAMAQEVAQQDTVLEADDNDIDETTVPPISSSLLHYLLRANPAALDALQLPESCYPHILALCTTTSTATHSHCNTNNTNSATLLRRQNNEEGNNNINNNLVLEGRNNNDPSIIYDILRSRPSLVRPAPRRLSSTIRDGEKQDFPGSAGTRQEVPMKRTSVLSSSTTSTLTSSSTTTTIVAAVGSSSYSALPLASPPSGEYCNFTSSSTTNNSNNISTSYIIMTAGRHHSCPPPPGFLSLSTTRSLPSLYHQ